MFVYRVGQKVAPLHLKTHIFCLYLQNSSTSFCDFWHTSTPFYSEYFCWFTVHQI